MRIESSNLNYIDLYKIKKEQKQEKVEPIQELDKEQIKENREVQNEELVALYFNHQATQAMKARVDTIFDSQSEDEDVDSMSYEDIRNLKKLDNRVELLKYYEENYATIQKEDETKIWA